MGSVLRGKYTFAHICVFVLAGLSDARLLTLTLTLTTTTTTLSGLPDAVILGGAHADGAAPVRHLRVLYVLR